MESPSPGVFRTDVDVTLEDRLWCHGAGLSVALEHPKIFSNLNNSVFLITALAKLLVAPLPREPLFLPKARKIQSVHANPPASRSFCFPICLLLLF